MELRCDNIQYSIEGSRILNGISLGVSNNEFHTILGPNGCGKTTFLKTVYRIIKPGYQNEPQTENIAENVLSKYRLYIAARPPSEYPPYAIDSSYTL